MQCLDVVFNSQIPMLGKHKPIPETTYEYPKDQLILDQVKSENRSASQVWKLFQCNSVFVNEISKLHILGDQQVVLNNDSFVTRSFFAVEISEICCCEIVILPTRLVTSGFRNIARL